MNFKTPALENFTEYLKQNFPNSIAAINSITPQLSTLDFSNCLSLEETYVQSIDLISNDTIFFTWNIDSLIHHIDNHSIPTDFFPILNLINAPALNLNTYTFNDVMRTVSQNITKTFIYKTDYIIIAAIPFFGGAAVVDGNHRLAHAILSNKTSVKCCFLPEDISYQFLQKECRRFIDLLCSLPPLY